MTEHTYEVRVTGLLPTTEVLDELGEVELAGHDVSTVLSGRFDDQAALSAFLRRLRAHGLEVLEIRRVLDGDDEPAQPAAGSPSGSSSGQGDQ
ncbi:hypothetical protein GCM10009844_04820 [Nocardioides koreensis]|uniref:Uncharacterized protein n=1 Tax=Nocardioides koreensis TaxID=433651 RepID=A0ABP5KUJ2_9ACTN